MPELPDVAGFARYVESTVLHRTVSRTHVADERILAGVTRRQLAARLKRRELQATHRHGKDLFIALDDGAYLVLHFGMTGQLAAWRADGREPGDIKVAWDLQDGWHLAYTCQRLLGEIGYTRDPARLVSSRSLGPDALDPDLSGDRFLELLDHRRGTAKGLLMNQSLIAGVGNVYSDEILFQAGIRPGRKVDRLSEPDRRELYRVMRRVLDSACERGNAVADQPGSWLIHHRDEGERCPRCGGPVQRETVVGRTSYWCRSCQR